MNVAVCLYGLFNNRYSRTSGAEGFSKFMQLARDFPEDDFRFWAFSTDENEAETIQMLYGTLGASVVIEPPQDFSLIIEKAGVDLDKFDIPDGFRSFQNALSFFYSRKRAIEMMLADTQDNDVDFVIVSRYDIGQLDRYNGRQRARVSELGFTPLVEKGLIYSAIWDQHNAGYADQWFVMSRNQAQIIAQMYDASLGFLMDGSNYLRHVTTGIRDSNAASKFTNERFLESGETQLAKIEKRKALDVHLMHKHYFVDSGLYESSMFSSGVEGLALLVYSHSEYWDVLDVFLGELHENFNAFNRIFLANERQHNEVSKSFRQILYSDHSQYVDRLIQILVQIPDDVIFFNHEDMILYDRPDMRHFLDAFELVKEGGYDYVRLACGGTHFGIPIPGKKGLGRFVRQVSPWMFSIQPSIWRRERLLELLSYHRGQGIWDFERDSQKTFKKLRIRGAYSRAKGRRRGRHHFDNLGYPYVATAIVKGEWNVAEYPSEIESFANKYDIDLDVRGKKVNHS